MQVTIKQIILTISIVFFSCGILSGQDTTRVEQFRVETGADGFHLYMQDSSGEVIKIFHDTPQNKKVVKFFRDGDLLYVQEEDGSVVKIGKEGIIVVEPRSESEIITQGDSILIRNNAFKDSTQIRWGFSKQKTHFKGKQNEDEKRFSTRLHIEFGWNNFIGQEGLGLPAAYDSLMNLMSGKSNNFALYLFSKYYLKKDKKLAIGLGAGFDFNEYMFAGNYVFGKDSSRVYVQAYPDNDFYITKNKFKTTSFIAPVLFEINFTDETGIHIGGYGGILISQFHKLFTFKSSRTRKIYGNYKLSPFRYGAKLVLRIGDINFYMNYDLNPYFKENFSSYTLNQISGGFLFRI